MTHKRKVKQRTSACEVPVDDLRLHIEDHMLRYKCDMDLISGAFPESAVQYALPETPESRSAEGRAAVSAAVCGLRAYGDGTSKQTFLLDVYLICETAADG